MNKFICIFICIFSLIIFSNNAYAGKCEDISEIAGQYMTFRQNGVPMKKVVATVYASDFTADAKQSLIDLIKIVYKRPLYSTKEMKQEAVLEFENMVYSMCLDN